MSQIDPNAVAQKNGQFLGLDVPLNQADYVLLQIPWDVTTSYRAGTVNGPEAVIQASYQLDLYSHRVPSFWNVRLATQTLDPSWKAWSERLRPKAEAIIADLEDGASLANPKVMRALEEVNAENHRFHETVYASAKSHWQAGRRVVALGGDHATSWGPLRACSEQFPGLSVLHIDAHADLRVAYEGFTHSHASIMSHVVEWPEVSKLVQVGIRDVSDVEVEMIKKHPKIHTFFDVEMKRALFRGTSWHSLCEQIVSKLGENVYVSFDIDGLDPKLCPHTGTPVPGGLSFEHMSCLFDVLCGSGRKLVGADLVEVAPGPVGDEWDGNVGARVLFEIIATMEATLKPQGEIP